MTNSNGSKKCRACGIVMPLSNFHRDSSRNDGLSYVCKECKSKRDKRRDKTKERNRTRSYRLNNLEKERSRGKTYYAEHKNDVLSRQKQYRIDFPERQYAKSAVAAAVKRGDLSEIHTLTCIKCGKQADEYHHDRYDRPLFVIPVCKSCHQRIHSEKQRNQK